MLKCLGFLALFIHLSAWAHEIVTQLQYIDSSTTDTDDILLYATTGHVFKLNQSFKDLNELNRDMHEKEWFRILYDTEHHIITISKIAKYKMRRVTQPSSTKHTFKNPYSPSILKDLDTARGLFYDSLTNQKESQCYSRAHAWAYEWRITKGIYSSKTWLFFTKRYIRKHQFEWWFHVAPMVHIVIDGKVQERLMDMKYARGPLPLKKWTDIFIRDSSDCPVVARYSEQADFPESGSCFILKSSMYYYQPVDLEELEINGIEKNFWIEPEVRAAYLDALDQTL